jgi:hypothetical protein
MESNNSTMTTSNEQEFNKEISTKIIDQEITMEFNHDKMIRPNEKDFYNQISKKIIDPNKPIFFCNFENIFITIGKINEDCIISILIKDEKCLILRLECDNIMDIYYDLHISYFIRQRINDITKTKNFEQCLQNILQQIKIDLNLIKDQNKKKYLINLNNTLVFLFQNQKYMGENGERLKMRLSSDILRNHIKNIIDPQLDL